MTAEKVIYNGKKGQAMPAYEYHNVPKREQVGDRVWVFVADDNLSETTYTIKDNLIFPKKADPVWG